MRLQEQFRVSQDASALWKFLDQPEAVARCMPGVESVDVRDDDHIIVTATQGIGPLHATFDAAVTVLERVPGELIRFRATGRSVRGASGNIRAENSVRLVPDGEGTTVHIYGDVVLAGALGGVGQKVVAKQAGRVTAQFAANLERALAGEELPELAATVRAESPAWAGTTGAAVLRPGAPPRDPWAVAAAVLSGVAAALSLVAIVRQSRGAR